MKPLTTTILSVFVLISSLTAQINPVKNSFQTYITKVLSDYPNGFQNIIGERLIENPQSIEFECKAPLKDAIKCRIIKYSSATRDIYSWEADMFRSEEFEAASRKFQAVYNSLQHLSLS